MQCQIWGQLIRICEKICLEKISSEHIEYGEAANISGAILPIPLTLPPADHAPYS